MADAGDLGRLSPELRKEIYSYVLVEPEKVRILRLEVKGLGKVARFNHHRNNKHRGKFYDRDARAWLDAPPSFTSLLYVNKSVALEATEVLYGFNEFEFLHAGALLCFLRHIGPSIQYLRSISLVGQGVLYNLHWDALDVSMELLAQVASLRSLEISHLALCGEHDRPSANRRPAVTPKTCVQHCKPLLGSLKAKAQSHNLSLSIVDLIQITLPDCAFDKYYSLLPGIWNGPAHQLFHVHSEPFRGIPFNSRSKAKDFQTAQCHCFCEAAEGRNRALVQEVKDEIVKQLGLSIEGEENENADWS